MATTAQLTAIDPMWVIVALLGVLLLMAVGMWAVRRTDDAEAYASFSPRYFETLGLQASSRWWLRAAGAALLFVLTQHHLFGVVFTLPTDPLHRTQRLMVLYVTLLAELAVLVLFYGTNNDSPALRFWAALIDMCVISVPPFASGRR